MSLSDTLESPFVLRISTRADSQQLSLLEPFRERLAAFMSSYRIPNSGLLSSTSSTLTVKILGLSRLFFQAFYPTSLFLQVRMRQSLISLSAIQGFVLRAFELALRLNSRPSSSPITIDPRHIGMLQLILSLRATQCSSTHPQRRPASRLAGVLRPRLRILTVSSMRTICLFLHIRFPSYCPVLSDMVLLAMPF